MNKEGTHQAVPSCPTDGCEGNAVRVADVWHAEMGRIAQVALNRARLRRTNRLRFVWAIHSLTRQVEHKDIHPISLMFTLPWAWNKYTLAYAVGVADRDARYVAAPYKLTLQCADQVDSIVPEDGLRLTLEWMLVTCGCPAVGCALIPIAACAAAISGLAAMARQVFGRPSLPNH